MAVKSQALSDCRLDCRNFALEVEKHETNDLALELTFSHRVDRVRVQDRDHGLLFQL